METYFVEYVEVRSCFVRVQAENGLKAKEMVENRDHEADHEVIVDKVKIMVTTVELD